MGRFREQEFTIKISYTTDGETVNRITGANMGGTPLSNEILIEYLRQFGGVNLVPLKLNTLSLSRDITDLVSRYLKNARNV